MNSYEIHNIDTHLYFSYEEYNFPFAKRKVFQIELFHDQLPLAVPCYDLLPVTEFTVG